MKVDAQIEEAADGVSPICNDILAQKFSCKKLSNISETYGEYSSQYKKNNFMLNTGQD